MPPRPPACCKAVRLQLFAPSDSIWVSGEVISYTWQRFCLNSRTSRRYGSSVPGPMESRRRLGKRRMTQVSERAPSPAHNLGTIWGSIWETDRTQWQWQWQAPSPRPSTQDRSAVTLPDWLLEWDTTPQEKTAEPTPLEEPVRVEDDLRQLGKQDVRQFRATMKGASRTTITSISMDFTLKFKQSLSLGLVSQTALEYALRYLSRDFRVADPDEKYTSSLCLAFYTAVWDGIRQCKVFGSAEIAPKIMSRLFSLVASLPHTQEMQRLAQMILHSATDNQLSHMEQGLTSMVQGWTESWFQHQELGECLEELQSAESLVTEAERNVTNARRVTMMLEGPIDEQVLSVAQEAIAGAHAAVLLAIDATIHLQDAIWPLQASIKNLARTLKRLPAEMLLKLVPDWSEQILKACTGRRRSNVSTAYWWLHTIARLPNVDYALLVQTWRQMDSPKHLHQTKCCQVILEHWISQGKVPKASAVRNTFDAYAVERSGLGGSEHFVRLLLALDKHRQMSLSRTKDLFVLLHKLDRPRYVSEILSRMYELDMIVPTTLLGYAVKEMSTDTKLVRRALSMWNIPDHLKVGHRPRPEFIPNFITSLINEPHVHPREIWRLLDIPVYENSPKFQRGFAKPLPKEMIVLIHKMATAFARTTARPPRVAFRNICQCLYHLRIHNAPILPEITRAVNHVYITGSILRGLYIGQERLRYCLHLISQVEGEDVANKVDGMVFQWRQLLQEKRAKERREANVLRVGPIQ